MTSAATPRTGKGSAPPSPRRGGAAGLGGRLPACPHPGSAWRRCLFLLPRLRARRGGGGRRQLQAGAWPGAAGRALLGRLLATGRGIEGLSRPRRGTARRPEGSGPERPRRSSPAQPGDPAPRCEGAEPFGAAGRGLPAREGLPLPRCPGDALAAQRGVHCRPRAGGVVSRPPHALGGSGLVGTAPPSPALPRAGAASSSLPRRWVAAGRAAALGGTAERLGIRP